LNTTPLQNEDTLRKQLEESLRQNWCQVLGVQTVGTHDDFFQLGGDPDRGARMLERVKLETKASIPVADLYEARTISKLADLIQIKQSSREQMCIVPIKPKGARRPLFLVHGVGGNVLGFAGLARKLMDDQPVYGIQAQALRSEGPTLVKLEAMADFYVREVRQVQPCGPYAFLGFSYGGMVAFEMARQLTATGESVDFLGMLDTWQPGYLKQVQNREPWAARTWNRLNLVRLNTRKLSPIQMVPYFYSRVKGRILRKMYGRMNNAAAVSLPDSMRKVRDINMAAALRYVVGPYDGRVVMFRAKDEASEGFPQDLGWRAYAHGGVQIVPLPGDHGQILAEPNLSCLAEHLERFLGARTGLPVADAAPEARDEFELDDEGIVPVGAFANASPTHEAETKFSSPDPGSIMDGAALEQFS